MVVCPAQILVLPVIFNVGVGVTFTLTVLVVVHKPIAAVTEYVSVVLGVIVTVAVLADEAFELHV